MGKSGSGTKKNREQVLSKNGVILQKKRTYKKDPGESLHDGTGKE